MVIIQLEHRISDFATWKNSFDQDPVHRAASGVRRYRIVRPIDDPNYVAVELEFDDRSAAERFQASLDALWRSAAAAPALAGTPRSRIVEQVEAVQY